MTKSTFIRLVQCPDLTSKQWLQATLPIRHGGFGLTNIESLSADVFVAGWAQSIQALGYLDCGSLSVSVRSRSVVCFSVFAFSIN